MVKQLFPSFNFWTILFSKLCPIFDELTSINFLLSMLILSKILLFRTQHLWNSTTELILIYLYMTRVSTQNEWPNWTSCHLVYSGHTFIPFFAAINKTSLDIQKLSIFVQSNRGSYYRYLTKFKKYKSWNPKVRLCIVIILSCPLIGCWATERANQRAAQNNYYIESDFGVPGFVLYKLCDL